MTTLLQLRVGADHKVIEMMIVDYPGEDFRNALRKLRHQEIEQLYNHNAQSEAILLLFDPDQDVRALDDPARCEVQIERQLAHLQAIAEIWAERTNGPAPKTRKNVGIAVIIAKADREPELTAPKAARQFFKRHAGALDAKLHQYAHSIS